VDRRPGYCRSIVSGDETSESADMDSPTSDRRRFQYLHRYADAEYVVTLRFPVGWLDSNGLTYRDDEVYRDGVLLAPHEYPPFESTIAEPSPRPLLDQIIEEATGYFPGDDMVIETDESDRQVGGP